MWANYYTARNAFKDGLAHYRISLAQKAVSIDLGLLVNGGAVAENQYLMDVMRRVGYLMDIEDDGFIALMDRYCDAIPMTLSQTEAQVLMSIETASAVRAKGIDLHQTPVEDGTPFSGHYAVGEKNMSRAHSSHR